MTPIPALLPLSWLYGIGVGVRNLLFDIGVFRVERLSVPVVSVGNIMAGGSGKTPLVELLVRMFLGKNIRTAVVSRGYKRTTRGTVVVSDGLRIAALPGEGGDEPYLLARKIPEAIVVVDEDRARGARYAVEQLHAKMVVLDDGFQHRSLGRDLDIVLLDALHPPLETPLLPAGFRREMLTSLKRADLVLLTKISGNARVEVLKEHIRRHTNAQVFTSSYNVAAFRRAKTKFSTNVNSIKGKTAVAFCGIARPESFRTSLTEIGLQVKQFIPFPDHHGYTEHELEYIVELHRKLSTDYVVTTEKDVARLTPAPERFLEAHPIFYLEMSMEIHQNEEWARMVFSVSGKQ